MFLRKDADITLERARKQLGSFKKTLQKLNSYVESVLDRWNF